VIDAGGTSSYVTNALNQYTSVGGAAYAYDGNGNMTYDGDGMMYAYDPENRLTTVNKIDGPLSPGCDIALSFTSGGDATWVLDTNEYSYDHDSARSGEIGDDQETWLQTTVTGPGTLTFDYKLSCDAGDEYAFSIDGQYRSGRAGSQDWTQSGPWTITGAGVHTIRWKFIKDSSGSSGSDCLWIDRIRWTGAMPDGEGWDRIEYAYDAAGRRIEKKVDGTPQVKYVYDGDHIIAEYNNAGTLLRKYVHGPCVDEPICMIEASGTYAGTHYYHYDALGSVVAMTNSAGNVVQLYEYSVYGQAAASDAEHPNRFMFTGREFDKDTGLYYYRARYYHPEIGRFLQTDPLGYGDGMNWYAYCQNGPGNNTDSSGMVLDYHVKKCTDCETGGILTYIGDDPNAYFWVATWEDWVIEMVVRSRQGWHPKELSPDSSDAGWKLAQQNYLAFWTIRALMHLVILIEPEVKEIEAYGYEIATINAPLSIENDTTLCLTTKGGDVKQIWWGWTLVAGKLAPTETWEYVLSPITALAHEMTHALYDARHNVPPDIEMICITVQNRTTISMYRWNPKVYQQRWKQTSESVGIAINPYRPGGYALRVPW
jgi:RHS repeat-associated protein